MGQRPQEEEEKEEEEEEGEPKDVRRKHATLRCGPHLDHAITAGVPV